jgi:hypothetical protein
VTDVKTRVERLLLIVPVMLLSTFIKFVSSRKYACSIEAPYSKYLSNLHRRFLNLLSSGLRIKILFIRKLEGNKRSYVLFILQDRPWKNKFKKPILYK